MTEHMATKKILQRKRHSVYWAVRVWMAFKKLVLEDEGVRKTLEQGVDRKQFNRLFGRLLKSRGPRKTRGKKSTAARLRRDACAVCYETYYQWLCAPSTPLQVRSVEGKGLGLFLKACAGRTITALPKELVGVLAKVEDEEEWQELVQASYPSLWQNQRILFGPLSLVNHACDAELQWKNPWHGPPHELLEGFQSVRLKVKEGRQWNQGELLVNYGMGKVKGFECSCRACMHL